MNILFISPNSPFISVGGVERYIKNLLYLAGKTEGNFTFLLPSEDEDAFEDKGNVKIYQKDFLNMSYVRKIGVGKAKLSQKEIQKKSKSFFEFLLDLFNRQKIDLVSAQNFHLGAPPAHNIVLNMACFLKKIPVVLRLHSFPEKTIHEEMINQLLWKKIICISKSVAGDCFQKGTDINKLITRYLGVNRDEFKSGLDKNWLRKELNLSPNIQIILCASRLVRGPTEILEEKGILNLIETFSKLAPRYKNLRLVIATAVPSKELTREFNLALEKLKGFIKLQQVEGRVICRRFKLEEMPLVYAGSDLFVLPSENETLGQVFIEAMACGIPVIGTKVGGIPEIISHNYNGFLVQPNDASFLAQKVEDLLNDQELRKKFIIKGLKTIEEKFSADKLFKKLLRYFEGLTKKA